LNLPSVEDIIRIHDIRVIKANITNPDSLSLEYLQLVKVNLKIFLKESRIMISQQEKVR